MSKNKSSKKSKAEARKETSSTAGDEVQIFGNYSVGGEDNFKQRICEILHASQDHAIYLVEKPGKGLPWWRRLYRFLVGQKPEKKVNWACGDAVKQHTIATFESAIAEIRALRADLPGSNQASNLNMARAVNLAMLGFLDLAKEIFEDERRRTIKLREDYGRARYLAAAAIPVGIILLIALGFASKGEALFANRIESLLYVTAAGVLAGFFSMVVGIRKLEIDIDQSYRTHLFYGLVRVTVAGIASVSAYVLMKAGLLFGDIVSSGNSAEILSVALVAGFSEALVPNLLQRTASEEVEKGTVADEEECKAQDAGPRL